QRGSTRTGINLDLDLFYTKRRQACPLTPTDLVHSLFPDSVGALFSKQLNLVTIRVLDKRQNGTTVFHRTRFTGDLATFLTNPVASGINILYRQRHMAVAIAKIVLRRIPVVGQLNGRAISFILITDKGQREAAFRVIL